MRILVIESDPVIAFNLKKMLKIDGSIVYVAHAGEEGIAHAKWYDFDITILSASLPDMSVTEALRKIRFSKKCIPILVISSDRNIACMVKALTMGADDYLSRPYHKDELSARICALVRRSRGYCDSSIRIGELTVMLDEKKVRVGNTVLKLTPKEYQLLELLALRKGQIIETNMLLELLYDGDEPERNSFVVLIGRMRRKIAHASQNRQTHINTVFGVGYVLREPETERIAAE